MPLLKFFFSIIFFFSVCSGSMAQKVKRKGVTPTQIDSKKATALYSLNQLQGRWQEQKRIPAGEKIPVDFSDTLQIRFSHDSVELRDATSMRMSLTGMAQIEPPDILIVAGDSYTIRKIDNSSLIIDDGSFTRQLIKKDSFYSEKLGHIKMDKDSFNKAVNVDINNLKGKWMVFARKAGPGTVNDQTALIKSIDIVSISQDGAASANVVFYTTDISETVPAIITISGTSMQIKSEKYSWNFNTYKATPVEFVFGLQDGLLYFSKHVGNFK